MKVEKKLFAFRLAEKRINGRSKDGKWQARAGISLQACSPVAHQLLREKSSPTADGGVFC